MEKKRGLEPGKENRVRPVRVRVTSRRRMCIGDVPEMSEEYCETFVGSLAVREGKYFLLYKECDEDGAQIRTVVRADAESFEVTRDGFVQTRMLFRTGLRAAGGYDTPYGRIPFMLEVEEAKICLPEAEEESGLLMSAEYLLGMDGQTDMLCDILLEVLD